VEVDPAPKQQDRVCERVVLVEIWKGERRLRAVCGDGSERVFSVALGREPMGDKRSAGDSRTPEGRYRIAGPARESRFHRFLPIDFPNPEDAAQAFAVGRISRAERDAIFAAHRDRELPPQDTGLGGDLGFHGEGPEWRGMSPDLDWTYGCIAMSDAEIDFLVERVTLETRVRIHP
jgi:murein L,D-transpeptidase YafK